MNEFERALAAEQGSVGASIQTVKGFRPRVGAKIRYQNVGAPVERVSEVEEDAVAYSGTEYVAAEQSVYGIGFGVDDLGRSLVVPAGNLAYELLFKPDRPINPSRFVMPSTIIGGFIIGVKIGGTDILPATNGIPWEFFSEVSTAPNIEWLTINTTPGVKFLVANPTAAPLLFTGAFYGTALRE